MADFDNVKRLRPVEIFSLKRFFMNRPEAVCRPRMIFRILTRVVRDELSNFETALGIPDGMTDRFY